MNRADFMKKLTELLADVPPAEREEAIQYYNDYFDDAGAENEQSVIASLGTPEQLAKSIKIGLADGGNTGEFTEKGFFAYEQQRDEELMELKHSSGAGNEGQSYQGGSEDKSRQQDGEQNKKAAQQSQDKRHMSGGMIALIVVLGICASPFLLGLGSGLLGIIIGIVSALFGIIIGLGAAGISLLVVGVCLFIYGAVTLFEMPLGGLALMGVAMICAAIGLFFIWLTVMICGMLIPFIFRGVVKLLSNIFHRGGVAA